MSYIRAGSNPEGLCIFNGGSGVEVYQGGACVLVCPYDVFNFLGKKFHSFDWMGEPVSYNRGKLEAVQIPNGKPNIAPGTGTFWDFEPYDTKVRFSYDDQHFDMWHVTAGHVFSRFSTPSYSELGFFDRIKWALFNN